MHGLCRLYPPVEVAMSSPKFFTLCLGLLLVFILAGCGAVFINQGSAQSSLRDGLTNPDLNKIKINVPPEQSMICNFDDGSKNTNPNLHGGSGGTWFVFSENGNAPNPNFIVKGGANGSAMCAHIFGSLTDKGDRSYPAFSIQGKFTSAGLYNASDFSGIQFYYKCPPADQAIKRRFVIATVPTLPADAGGACISDCYNHFGAMLGPTSDWKLCSYKFTELSREQGWGSPVTPPDLIDHLKEFIYLEWDHSGDNNAGTYNIDYWIDDVGFF